MEQNILPTRTKRRFPTWGRVVASILLLLALLVFIPRLVLRHKISAELAAMRADGYPTTLAELDAWYEYPAGDNAADVLINAFGNHVNTNQQGVPLMGDTYFPSLGQQLPEEMKAKIAAYLSDNAKAIELLHKGAAIPGCRFPVVLKSAAAVMLPHLNRIGQMALLIELEAIVAAEDGESEKAGDALVSGLLLARSLRNEPLVFSQMVRYAMHGRVSASAERVLSRTALSDAILERLVALAASEEDARAFERSLAGDALMTHAQYEYSMDFSHSRIERIVYVVSDFIHKDQLTYLRLSRRALALAKLSMPDGIAGAEALRKEFLGGVKKRFPLVPDMLPIFGPTLESAFPVRARDVAHLGTLRTALAVERFRLAKSRLPECLAEVTPDFVAEVPEDPFDGKPLRYRKEEEGYVVYSIGRNLRDDMGRTSEGYRPDEPDDIAFRVVR